MSKRILYSIIALMLLTSLLFVYFCFFPIKPRGNPQDILDGYNNDIINTNYESAFDRLASATISNLSKDDFFLWMQLMKETFHDNSVKVEKINEFTNKDIDGVVYKNVVEFSVTQSITDLYDNKENKVNYKRNVVSDNGVWKVYREKENVKDRISGYYINLAKMYIDGKGKEKDLNEAATLLTNSINYNNDFAEHYYVLSYVYYHLQRYNDAIDAINIYINKVQSKEEKSNAYTLLGCCYQEKYDFIKSKENFQKALDLDPNNEYAKTNMSHFKN